MDKTTNLFNTNEEIKLKRNHVIYETFFVYLLATLINLLTNVFFTTLTLEEFIPIMLQGSILLLGFILLLLSIRFLIHHLQLQYTLYFVLSLLFTQMVYIISDRQYIVSVTPVIFVMFIIMFTMFKYKYILLYSFMAILSLVATGLRIPEKTLTLGPAHIQNVIVAIIVFTFCLVRLLQVFRWYDRRLHEELTTSHNNNIELSALNEEYLATEEELFAQYEEIKELHQNTSLLLDQQTAIFEASDDGVIEYDISNNSFDLSQKAVELLGETKDTLTLQQFSHHLSYDDFEEFKSQFELVKNKTFRKIILELDYHVDSTIYYCRITLLNYTSDKYDSDYIIMVIKDITLEKNQADHIYNLAYYDELTGLYNRIGFLEKLTDMYLNQGRNFSLILLDLDNFKYYNDTFGYKVGDVLIQQVAESLSDLLLNGELIGRIGSDDFAIILEHDVDPEEFVHIINSNKHQFIYEDTEFHINYSIGIASSHENSFAIDILKHAEIAMYKVKETGKNNYAFFESDYSDEMHNRLVLTNALEKAILNQELSLEYQPIYGSASLDTTSHSVDILGFEALVRWSSTKHGKIPPNEFIPLAEQSGFIYELGRYIIKKACSFAKKLNTELTNYHVTINISSKQLLNTNFYDDLMTILKDVDVDPKFIGIEITESAVIENYDLAISTLNQIRALGINTYLDDFGTGYSSLNYLSQLPIDVLKIDKSFIDHVHESHKDHIMVSNIIHMANSFELTTVAEGVESNEQYICLKDLGCQFLQGYYFSKPLSESDAMNAIIQ